MTDCGNLAGGTYADLIEKAKDLERLQKANDDLKRKFREDQTTIHALQENNKRLYAEGDTRAQRIAELVAMNENQIEIIEQKDRDVKALRAERDSLLRQNAQMIDEMEVATDGRIESDREKGAEIDALEAKVAELDTMNKQQQTTISKMAATQSQLDEAKNVNVALKDQWDTLSQAYRNLLLQGGQRDEVLLEDLKMIKAQAKAQKAMIRRMVVTLEGRK